MKTYTAFRVLEGLPGEGVLPRSLGPSQRNSQVLSLKSKSRERYEEDLESNDHQRSFSTFDGRYNE